MTATTPRFIQITSDRDGLYALDEDGNVWMYYPAVEGARTRFAFWGRLTTHRADPQQHSSKAVPAHS